MINIENSTDKLSSYSYILLAAKFVNKSTASEKQEKPLFFNCVILYKNNRK